MRIFIYARKSVYSDTSDSVDNQLRMCREYCETHFSSEDERIYSEYFDEDFSGKNTDRPGLRRMMDHIRAGESDMLIVYQLDRFTRSVRDFSELYQQLSDHHTDFVSVKETIDTSTPIGRAMMYIIVIFAQMERETTAARVTDNMRGLARKGWWTGGNPPIGYARTRVEKDGRRHVLIVPEAEGAEYVRRLFRFFIDGGYSLQGCETALKHEGVKAPGGGFMSTTQIHQLLTSPVYAPATKEVYDYYADKGCRMDEGSPRKLWDGSVGVIVYGRTSESTGKHRKTPPSEWLVCLGHHEPILSAETWLAAQEQLGRNKMVRKKKHPVRLLKGTLRCGCCGTLMQVSYKRRANGEYNAWYYCLKRMRQGTEACHMGHIKCELLDEKVLDIFRIYEADPDILRNTVIRKEDSAPAADPETVRKKLAGAETRLSRLTAMLGECSSDAQERAVLAEVGRQAEKVEDIRKELEEALRSERRHRMTEAEIEDRVKEVQAMIHGLEGFSAEEKNAIVHKVFRTCTWDGETLTLGI